MSAEIQVIGEDYKKEAFKKQMLSHYSALAQDTLSRFRAKAWDHFEELGLPSKNMEVFQYIKLKQLFGKNFTVNLPVTASYEEIAPHVLPECKKSYIVFVNGHLDLGLSCFEALPKKTVVITLQEALRSFGSFINTQVAKLLQEEIDPFAALNGAFIQRALFLYIPPNTQFENPLQILHVVKGSHGMLSPRIEVFAGALSQTSFITTSAYIDAEDTFFNGTSHFVLEEGANICHYKTMKDLPASCWHLDANRATLKKDSSFKSVSVNSGAQTMREDFRVSLVGPNAEANLSGLTTLSGKKESHVHVLMDHQAPDCRSMQLFKSVLDDSSRASFEGKIYVHKEAQKTQAFQLNNNLLLSDFAQSDCKPNLEIFADDVKASHGATCGTIDEESLIYLCTRGIPKNAAKKMLVEGFCCEVLDQIPLLKR